MSPEEDRTHDAVDSEPKHYQLSYFGPLNGISQSCCIAEIYHSGPQPLISTHSSLLLLSAVVYGDINYLLLLEEPPRWPSGKASALRAEDPEFESRLHWDFFGVESYQ